MPCICTFEKSFCRGKKSAVYLIRYAEKAYHAIAHHLSFCYEIRQSVLIKLGLKTSPVVWFSSYIGKPLARSRRNNRNRR